ncbi:hypothetical protein [Halomicrococcus gelatinilyticus]|uniref:hypothetical protein n=1 Tax=Halomicrococcus gelatinilyticus TaxID=1702103 RepID=UPI002E15050B
MASPSRWLARLGLVFAFVPVVVAGQPAPGVETPSVSPLARVVGGGLSTLVVGGLLLAAAPDYTDRIVDQISDEPVACFGWGLAVLVLFVGTTVLLAITVVGIVLVIPLVLAVAVVGVVGSALGYLALFGRVVESRWLALGLGALVAGLTNVVPVLGSVVGFVVGSVGVGAVVRDWRT